jgi:hypothetical protein
MSSTYADEIRAGRHAQKFAAACEECPLTLSLAFSLGASNGTISVVDFELQE